MPRVRGLTVQQKTQSRTAGCEKRRNGILGCMMNAHKDSQETLGKLVNRSRQTISLRMNGRQAWPLDDLIIIADHYHADDTTRAALLGGKEKCRWEA